jgi:hypothetical protein
LASWPTNEKTPQRGERGASEVVIDIRVISTRGESTAFGLPKPGVLTLRAELAEDRAVHGGDNVAELCPSRGH